jgi:multidrug efflux pump subunit AcrB
VDAVLNMGLPAPIDVQVSATNLADGASVAAKIARRAAGLGDVSDVLVPQDIDAPALRVNVDRLRVGQLGLNEQDVVDNIITALTSNAMIAPSYWIDPNTGNDYFLTVQYPEGAIKTLNDLKSIPLRSASGRQTALLEAVAKVQRTETPTEVDHYQLRRVIDVFVAPKSEALGGVANEIDRIIARIHPPEGTIVTMRGTVQAMRSSFRSFGLGLIMAVALVYLILVAQFRSFVDPFLILLAVPPGITGVLIILALSGTTLNIMSLMGVVMLVGIATSNSILIVEFTHRLIEDGMAVRQAVSHAVRVRLRPVLMTSLATLIGLIPMALKLGEGSESYAPLARSIIGGLAVSVVLTVFIVPAAFLLVYGRREPRKTAPADSRVLQLTPDTFA